MTHYVLALSRSGVSLCNPMDCSPPDSSVHGDSPVKNTGVGCHVLLQGISLTQGILQGIFLPHCRQILYHLSHQESPFGTSDHFCGREFFHRWGVGKGRIWFQDASSIVRCRRPPREILPMTKVMWKRTVKQGFRTQGAP